MRWNCFVINAVKWAELFFFQLIHRISYIDFQQKSMRWIFVRNAVNFCKKWGKIWRVIFFYRIHCNHPISYKKSSKNLDPGVKNNCAIKAN